MGANIAIIAMVVLVTSVALAQHTDAMLVPRNVVMTITNTNTDTVKTIEWTVNKYSFEKDKSIDIDDMKLKKIKEIFGTNEFIFRSNLEEHKAEWHHFEVTMTADPGRGSFMRITFF